MMDRVLEARTHGFTECDEPVVQMASRVVSSVVEQTCDVLDTMREHVTECNGTRTMVPILDLLDNAEMVFEEAANTWRAVL